MAVLVNESGTPRDVWTELGWKHAAVGATLEAELDEAQVLELLDLGFSEVKAEKAKPASKAEKADAE